METFTNSTLSILSPNGRTVGTGFLVSKDLVVTCAHVVVAADPLEGDNTIMVQFTGQNEKLEVLIVPQYWRDVDNGDVAFLRLKTVPDGLTSLRLGLASHCRPGNPFNSFGYATAADIQGIIARGSIDGYLPRHKLLQLQAPQANHGISGAPVLDEKRGVVVGMITKGHTEQGRNEQTTFATPAELLFEICPDLRPSETCPYQGLATFTEETAQFFFGREALTDKLYEVLRGGCRFLAVFGPSGSGKSSVVRAGLLPKLEKGLFANWKQISMRPEDDPFAQMKSAGLQSLESLPGHVLLFIDQFEELFTRCSDTLRNEFVRKLVAALESSRFMLVICMRDDFYSAFNAKAAPLAQSDQLKIENVPGTLKRDELVAMIERPAVAVGLALEEGLTELIMKDLTHAGEVRSSTLPLLEFALTQLWEKRRDGLMTHAAYQTIGGVTGSLAGWADDAYRDLPKTDKSLAESLLTSLVHLGDEAQGLPDTRKHRALAEFNESTLRVIKHFADRRLLITSDHTVELVHDALLREWGRLQDWIKKDRDNLRLLEDVTENAHRWENANRDESLLNHRGPRLELALSMSKNPRYQLNPVEQAYLDACVGLRKRKECQRRIIMIGLAAGFVITLVFAGFVIYLWREAQRQSQVAQSRTEELKNLANVDNVNKLLSGHNPDLALALAMQTTLGEKPPEKAYSALLDAAYLSLSQAVYPLCLGDNRDNSWANSVDISPDNQWAAVGCFWKNQGQEMSKIYIINLKTGDVKENWPDQRARIFNLAFSPDGKLILAGYGDWAVILWDLNGSKIKTLSGHSGAVSAVAFNAEGDKAVTASYDKTVILWDIKTGEVIFRLSGADKQPNFMGKFTSIDYSSDGKSIAFGDELGNVTIWDGEKGLKYFNTPDDKHSNFVLSVKFSPDCLKVYSSYADSTIAVWDVNQTNKPINLLKAPGYKPGTWINNLKLLPDGNHLLAAMADGSILFWDLSTLQVIQHLDGHLGEVVSLDISSDNTFAISGARDGSVRVWDLRPFENTKTISLPQNTLSETSQPTGEITDIALLNNGDGVIISDSKGYIHLGDANNKSFSDDWQVQSDESPITSIAISPDESQILTGGGNGQVTLWDLGTQKAIWNVNHKKGSIRSVDINPDGKAALLGFESGEITLLNINTGETSCELSGHTNTVNSVRFSPDGKYAASGSNDHAVMWWDLENCIKIKTLYQHDSWVMEISFRPDGKQLASVSADGSAILWDIESGRQVYRLKLPDNDINSGLDVFMLSVNFSPDGRLLTTGSANGIIGMWSVANGMLIRRFIQPPAPSCTLSTHCFWISEVKFSPQGDQLWSGSADGTLRTWPLIKVVNSQELRTWIEKNRYLYQLTPQDKDVYGINP